MYPTDENEINSVIKIMKPKCSSGHDSLSAKLVCQTAGFILIPLTHIINISLLYGVVPSAMKLAKITPIFKSGDTSIVGNYRPISLLPTFSKILERVVYIRLYKYLKTNHIITSSQYGFQNALSTELAILELQDRIAQGLASGSWCVGLFLDLSKAFDTINHKILLNKLEKYGIVGHALNWFKDYLSNRQQYTSFNNSESSVMSISCGVPQGSILGPLLFLIYVNDIKSVIKFGTPVLFADDTNILYFDKILSDISNKINKELIEVSAWFIANKLSVNTDKTKFMLFHPKRRHPPLHINITIEDKQIEEVASIKFLGVKLQENLSWKCHIDTIANKIVKVVGILNRLKHQLPEVTLLLIYTTLIQSHISYAISVWGGSPQCDIKRIHILQKKLYVQFQILHITVTQVHFFKISFINCQ